MASVQETLCRFCLKTITDKRFKVIDNDIKDIQNFLLLKLKLDDESEVICLACKRKLYAALQFKAICLNADYSIIPYLNCNKALQLDVSQEICRLCMIPVENEFRCIREDELEAIQKLIPEMNIYIFKDPVLCKECFDSLCTHNSFLREVEEKCEGLFESQATESQIDTTPSDLCVKSVNPDEEFDINEMEMSIQSESVDTKSEDKERRLLQNSDNEPFEKSDCRDAKEDGYKHENRSGIKYKIKTKQKRNVLYKCDKCIYETGSEIHFKAHYVRHVKDLKVYKCERCKYETENKKLLQNHQLKHKDTSQVRIYWCNDCNFETKYSSDIKRHRREHEDPSWIQMYKCIDCNYKAKYKRAIKQHQLKHKVPSQNHDALRSEIKQPDWFPSDCNAL
ncbi:zinc finger protein 91-like [Anoplophora glabripennis]|uniref:zinc finger protein 91-like n=1 Tax=Anoplophora glabripennis TaxID=217634 RepID=UPI000873F4AA|nr:zinc finger protein 91-like [Anoplophora glabripennis]